MRELRRIGGAAFSAMLVAACAAPRAERGAAQPEAQAARAKAPADAEADAMQPSGSAQQQGYPQQPGMAPPPSPAPPAAGAPAPAETKPQSAAGPSRAAAIARAGTDLEAAQRELDVAAGDCRNACRALGSMDRAAGHLCELARGGRDGEETRRCDDARSKVLSARDRVKQTCGACPGGPSVERNDPVPSLR